MAQGVKWLTEKERLQARREASNKWKRNNKEKNKEIADKWKKENPILYRMSRLLSSYKTNDKIANRGEGDLTLDWMIENIAFATCPHCGKSGWDVIGCNRLDNSLPHTKDNCEPCCLECNKKLAYEDNKRLVVQMDKKTDEVLKVWNSISEAANELNLYHGNIIKCCRGKLKTTGNFKFKYYE